MNAQTCAAGNGVNTPYSKAGANADMADFSVAEAGKGCNLWWVASAEVGHDGYDGIFVRAYAESGVSSQLRLYFSRLDRFRQGGFRFRTRHRIDPLDLLMLLDLCEEQS